jgi:hypothetical protein
MTEKMQEEVKLLKEPVDTDLLSTEAIREYLENHTQNLRVIDLWDESERDCDCDCH